MSDRHHGSLEEALRPLDEAMRRHTTFARLAHNETYAALALAGATVAALVWANIGGSYVDFWSIKAGIDVGGFSLHLTLSGWVDQGLTSLFFFAVGLDVRRELTLGSLHDPRRALLPIAGALGGLIVPAVIFLVITHGQEYSSAWGSVISTDTAFAVGLLALVGPKNAPRLRTFLLALAVVDDIGALIVIAVFYTAKVDLVALGLAALGLAAIWLLQRRGVWRASPYVVLGVYTWLALYRSGVHATLAGVLIALLMPVYAPRRRDVEYAAVFFRLFRQAPAPDAARTVRAALMHAVPLNQRLSAVLPPYVNYLVVPLFALANAGIIISGDSLAALAGSPLTWGVIAGLVVGKFVGITLAVSIVFTLVPGSRLPGLDMPRIAGAAALSGMGFTISLLVINIAVQDAVLRDQARIGVLIASLVAFGLAWLTFRAGDRFAPLPPPTSEILAREVDPDRDHIRGPRDAPATLVVFAAMDVTYRRHTAEALTGVRRRLGDGVRVVYRHHTSSDESVTAALALEAAAAEGAFWEMHDAMVRSPRIIDQDSIVELAQQAGLDGDALAERVQRTVDLARVDDDNLDAEAAHMPDTPVLYAQGKRVRVPPNTWQLVELLTTAGGRR